jgi:hypothetical protein
MVLNRETTKRKLYKILLSLRKENKIKIHWSSNDFNDFIEALRWEINQHLDYVELD